MRVDEVSEIITQMLTDDKTRNERYKKIDEAIACVFTPDANVASLPFVTGRQFALTDIADAKNAGVRTFTSLLPNVTIAPVMDNEGEYDRVDKMEQAWKWELEKMNRPVNGQKGIHDQIVESAITYHAVALQTEYLPYKLKGKNDPRTKAILSRKCHQWTLHHPGSVHAKFSEYGMEHVAKVSEFTALQLKENFGADNPGIQMLIEGKKIHELMKEKYTLVDYTNWTDRVQYIKHDKKNIELMNDPHGLPFIPWVVVDYGDPLWQSILDSGHWNNLQHLKLIKFSKAVAMGMRSDLVVQTTDGTLKNVWIDYQNPTNPIVIGAGDRVQPLPGNNLDPQFEAEYQEARSDVSRSTVAKVLQDITPYMNSPFSSLNAGISMALGQLAPARRTAEAAEAEAIFQGFQWIKHSKIPMNSYRAKTTDGKMDGEVYKRGGHIVITHEEPPTEEEYQKMSEKEAAIKEQQIYFDLSALYVNVELKSANITDEQAKINLLINAIDRIGMSKKEAWERMGWDGYEMNQSQRVMEALLDGEIKKALDMKALEVQQAAQQAQQQAEQEAAQAQQQAMMQQSQQAATQDMNAASQFSTTQGMDMRGGGMAAAQSAPMETRNTINGQTDSGDAMI